MRAAATFLFKGKPKANHSFWAGPFPSFGKWVAINGDLQCHFPPSAGTPVERLEGWVPTFFCRFILVQEPSESGCPLFCCMSIFSTGTLPTKKGERKGNTRGPSFASDRRGKETGSCCFPTLRMVAKHCLLPKNLKNLNMPTTAGCSLKGSQETRIMGWDI